MQETDKINSIIEQLKEERDRLLYHCVGMTYNMQLVFEIDKEIKECQKKLVKELSSKESEE